jgi:hypothetical protein
MFICSKTSRVFLLALVLLLLLIATIGIAEFFRRPGEITFRIVDSKTGVPLTNVTVVINKPDLVKTIQARLSHGWYESAKQPKRRRVIWSQKIRTAQDGRFIYDVPGQLIAPSQIIFICPEHGYARFNWTNGPLIVYEPSNHVRPPNTNVITITLQPADISGTEGLLSSEGGHGSVAAQKPVLHLALRITDEEGHPIAGAMGGASAEIGRDDKGGPLFSEDKGFSDANGWVRLRLTPMQEIYYGAQKDGYYPTRGLPSLRIQFPEDNRGGYLLKDVTNTVILRPIRNPVSMFARRMETMLPLLDEFVGFDLEKGDWVQPHGAGVRSDLLIRGRRMMKSRQEYRAELEIKFPNKGDGIQEVAGPRFAGSNFLLPRFAPEGGYEDQWSRRLELNNNGLTGAPDPQRAFFFRVRSVVNDSRVLEAKYGKIKDDIDFSPLFPGSKTLYLRFRYYLNPDGTRNMEFDPKQNLFGQLRGHLTVTAP